MSRDYELTFNHHLRLIWFLHQEKYCFQQVRDKTLEIWMTFFLLYFSWLAVIVYKVDLGYLRYFCSVTSFHYLFYSLLGEYYAFTVNRLSNKIIAILSYSDKVESYFIHIIQSIPVILTYKILNVAKKQSIVVALESKHNILYLFMLKQL